MTHDAIASFLSYFKRLLDIGSWNLDEMLFQYCLGCSFSHIVTWEAGCFIDNKDQ